MKKFLVYAGLGMAMLLVLLVVMPSGSRYCAQGSCGIFYWGAHEHDGVWHQALVATAFRSWPPKFPTYAGAELTGYNWLMDLPLALLARLSGSDGAFWYFKLLPLVWVGLMIWSWNKFAESYRPTPSYRFWLWFFLLLGNSLGFVLTWWHQGTIWGGSGILAMQSPQMLTNIQFALSLPAIAYGLYLMKKGVTQGEWWLLAGLVFITMGLKFYGGVILWLMSLVYGVGQKGWRGVIKVTLALILAGLIFYNPLQQASTGPILSWTPLATVHPIIEDQNLFYIPRLATARYSAINDHAWLKLILVEVLTILIFLVFNYGTRLIALGVISMRKVKAFDWVLIAGIAAGLLLNMLTTQRGEWWNTVQFLYYSLILTAVYAAEAAEQWSSRGKGVIVGMIILFTIPNAFDTARIFGSFPPGSYISDGELAMLGELKKQPEGVVLALPVAPNPLPFPSKPSPLYSRYDSAYVSAYTAKPTYLNDLVQMRLTGIDYQHRLDRVNNVDCSVLDAVDYLYITGPELNPWEKCIATLELIGRNEASRVWRVH